MDEFDDRPVRMAYGEKGARDDSKRATAALDADRIVADRKRAFAIKAPVY